MSKLKLVACVAVGSFSDSDSRYHSAGQGSCTEAIGATAFCGARVRDATTTYVQEIDGHLAAVTDVPVQTCLQCGERYLSPETVEKLQRLLDQRTRAVPAPKTIEVPVFPFS